jgi:predicted RND superfamily exporter protein
MGLGLERLGPLALRRPGLVGALLALATLFAALQIPKLRFDGDITVVLPAESAAFANYREQKADFRDFTRDVTLLVKSDRLATAAGLEDLRTLALDLAVADGVEQVFSLFSLPDPDPQTGRLENFFPETIADDTQAKALLSRLLAEYPQAGSLVSPQNGVAALVIAFADLANGDKAASGQQSLKTYATLKKAAIAAAPADFELNFTGLTPISSTIIQALIGDQIKMTVLGLALGLGIAFWVFRSLVAALICAIGTGLTILWSLATFAWFGIPVTYLSTVLPTLAFVLAFADSIVMYHRWHDLNARGGDLHANLAEAVERVAPATSLTSITTFIAFLSFLFSPGSALKEFALLGAGVVMLAFFAVILGLPVAGYWLAKLGVVRPGQKRRPAFAAVGDRFAALVRSRASAIAACGLALTAVLAVLHFQVRPEFRMTDYLPYESATRKAEDMANRMIGGRAMLFLSVPAAVSGTPFARENLARLQEVEKAIAAVARPERIVSATALGGRMRTPEALAELERQFLDGPLAARSSYQSRDGKRLMLGIRIASDQSIQTTLAQMDAMTTATAALAYGQDIRVAGFDALMAREFTSLIARLRNSLIMAILMNVVIIGIAARSARLTLAALTPNLLPILAIEMFVWLRGGGINMSEVIALTIAFGIAVDNAVHILNIREGNLRSGAEPDAALANAMGEVGPALVASCAIICTSTLVTQTSVLPMVPTVGALIIATLIVALIANLAILPANLWALERRGK